jgi:hypothetical protein
LDLNQDKTVFFGARDNRKPQRKQKFNSPKNVFDNAVSRDNQACQIFLGTINQNRGGEIYKNTAKQGKHVYKVTPKQRENVPKGH